MFLWELMSLCFRPQWEAYWFLSSRVISLTAQSTYFDIKSGKAPADYWRVCIKIYVKQQVEQLYEIIREADSIS